jgi:hypothetical protein
MEDPMKNCLTPRSTVMTPMICFYCGQEQAKIGKGILYHLFGIKHCDNHVINAIRDCNAYQHREDLLVMDKIENPEILKFIDLLDGFPDGFSVERSSGEIQPGWKINKGYFWEPAFIKKIDGYWTIPCTNDGTYKNVKLINFIRHVPIEDILKIVEDIIDILDEGVYKKDQEEYEKVFNKDTSSHYEDAKFIKNVLFEGQVCRIVIPNDK